MIMCDIIPDRTSYTTGITYRQVYTTGITYRQVYYTDRCNIQYRDNIQYRYTVHV